MKLTLTPMTETFAREIDGWHYEGVYSFYDLAEDPKDRREFLDPTSWPDTCFAVVDEREDLIGFFSFTKEGKDLALGLGLRPNLTGQGLGGAFLEAGLSFGRQRYRPRTFRLSVATFNQRAIRVYERAGFVQGRALRQETNGGVYEFVEMTRLAQIDEGLGLES